MEGLKICMRYVFILSALIIAGIFATDWWFTKDGDLLNDTLCGCHDGGTDRLGRRVRHVLHSRKSNADARKK